VASHELPAPSAGLPSAGFIVSSDPPLFANEASSGFEVIGDPTAPAGALAPMMLGPASEPLLVFACLPLTESRTRSSSTPPVSVLPYRIDPLIVTVALVADPAGAIVPSAAIVFPNARLYTPAPADEPPGELAVFTAIVDPLSDSDPSTLNTAPP
jgi:hypothetical protein